MGDLERMIELGEKHVNSLSHGGKKGMKWGYNDGKRNGKKTAGELVKDALADLKRDLNNPELIMERYKSGKYKDEYEETMKREDLTDYEKTAAEIRRFYYILAFSNLRFSYGDTTVLKDLTSAIAADLETRDYNKIRAMTDSLIKASKAKDKDSRVKIWTPNTFPKNPKPTDLIISPYYETHDKPSDRVKDRKKPGLTNSLGR